MTAEFRQFIHQVEFFNQIEIRIRNAALWQVCHYQIHGEYFNEKNHVTSSVPLKDSTRQSDWKIKNCFEICIFWNIDWFLERFWKYFDSLALYQFKYHTDSSPLLTKNHKTYLYWFQLSIPKLNILLFQLFP